MVALLSSLPGLTRQSSKRGRTFECDAGGYWIPAFAGMTMPDYPSIFEKSATVNVVARIRFSKRSRLARRSGSVALTVT